MGQKQKSAAVQSAEKASTTMQSFDCIVDKYGHPLKPSKVKGQLVFRRQVEKKRFVISKEAFGLAAAAAMSRGPVYRAFQK